MTPGWVDIHTHTTGRWRGTLPFAVELAWRNDASHGELRSRLCAGPAR